MPYERWADLSPEGIVLLHALAIRFSPFALESAGIFVRDREKEFCKTSGNWFPDIADAQIAGIDPMGVTVSGQRVQVSKIMFVTQDWLPTNYRSPIGELEVLSRESLPEEKLLARRAGFAVILAWEILIVVAATCSPSGEPWIRLDRMPETFLCVIWALSVVHSPLQ
jgi:hypothetical protein